MKTPMTTARRNLPSLLFDAPDDVADAHEWRRLAWRVALPAVAAALLVGAWTSLAPLAGAVIAPAQLKVELNRKTVQHQEGGIVRQLLVRDGQRVRAGDPLLVVGDLRGEADLGLLQDQWRAARARAARAEAESLFAARFPGVPALEADNAAAEHVARERAVFDAHRRSLDEQTTLLQAQIREGEAQATAVQAQIEATRVSGKLSDEELAINEGLASQGFVNHARVIGLQRVAADYRSRIGEQQAELAATRQRMAELRGRVAQLRQSQQTQAADELKDAAARLRELEERLRPSRDQVERQTVRAPVDGQVMSLRVAAPGAVVGPREPLLEVVPEHEKLVVEARIAPQDIEHVHVGGAAEVRLETGDARNTPMLPARVTFVSADRVAQPDGSRAGFDVTVEVDAATLRQRLPALRLTAGMPAELYVTTGERTLLAYLAKPLFVFMQRALREPG